MNLSKKLITLSVTLAIVPMTIITLISVYSLLKLNGNAVDNGRAAAKVQALNMLENIVAVEVRTVKDHIDRLSVIVGYLAKSDGVVLFTTLCDDAKDVKKDELQFALQSVKFNMQYCYATNFIETKQGRKYYLTQIRLFDTRGNELVILKNGKFEEKLGTRNGIDWFETAMKLPKDKVQLSDVEVSKNTNLPEMRVSSAIYSNGKLLGVVVANLDWSATRTMLEEVSLGSGYCYITNAKGELVTHPKYTIADKFNITDASKAGGELAKIVKDRMLPLETGSTEYQFEGVRKFQAFAPIKLDGGNLNYVMAATMPLKDFMVSVEKLDLEMVHMSRTILICEIVACAIVLILSIVLGIMVSRGISKQLKKLALDLSSSSVSVQSGATQVASASETLAQGASEQASAVEETSASTEEMSSMANANAENASKAMAIAVATIDSSKKGAEAMSLLESAMKDIKKSSDATTKILKTIDEIAFQTNLLALNAAVEAARAGEAGKGFAVVAEEVRSLARRSAEAAKNTAELIGESIENTSKGVNISMETAAALNEITELAQKMNKILEEITTANAEQAKGVAQIGNAIIEIEKVTQSNAAEAEESASASEELNSQAQKMMMLVNDLLYLVSGTIENNTAEISHDVKSTVPLCNDRISAKCTSLLRR